MFLFFSFLPSGSSDEKLVVYRLGSWRIKNVDDQEMRLDLEVIQTTYINTVLTKS